MLFPIDVSLVCSACGARYVEVQQVVQCPICSTSMDLAIPENAPSIAGIAREGRGVWRYRDALPIADTRHIVSLGEGATPIVELPRWGAAIGAPRASAKLEYFSQTGSFKDRGMTLVISRAVALGATSLIEDSSGNAGASTGAYAARAGLAATVYVPASAPPAKVRQIAATGATVIPIPGPRERVKDAAVAACVGSGAYYVGHNLNPFFSWGMTTFAYEMIEELGERLPDHIIMPSGGGSLYVGNWRGLRLWLGPKARLPRLHLVQPVGCCPIVAAQAIGSKQAVAIQRSPTIAGGAEIEHPDRDRAILLALSDTYGVAIAVDDDAIRRERKRLAELEGIDVEPTSALALAGLAELVRRGIVSAGESVLIAITGSGLKVPADS